MASQVWTYDVPAIQEERLLQEYWKATIGASTPPQSPEEWDAAGPFPPSVMPKGYYDR